MKEKERNRSSDKGVEGYKVIGPLFFFLSVECFCVPVSHKTQGEDVHLLSFGVNTIHF